MSKISVIGSGFSGLSTAAFLAKEGHKVSVFEKNSNIGGRARQFQAEGYTFDMGPSWYWMTDVFDKFFAQFDKRASDYFELIQLNPGFQIIFEQEKTMKLSSEWSEVLERKETPLKKNEKNRENKQKLMIFILFFKKLKI